MQKGAVLLVMLCQSTQAVLAGGLALFLPLVRASLGLSYAEAGALSSASILVYACMQVPSGYLADRLGPRRLFLTGLAGTNLLAFTFAWVPGFGFAVANQAASGFFRALVFAPGLLLIGALFPRERRATALGLFAAGGFVASILVNALGPILVGPLGWRGMFVLFSATGLSIFAAYWLLGDAGPAARAPRQGPLRAGLALFRRPTMWLVAFVQYVRYAVVSAVGVWLPTYVVVERHHSLRFAGLLVALAALVTASSNFVGGYVSDRLRNPPLVIGASLAVLAVSTFGLARATTLPLLLGAVLLNAFFLQLYFGPLFALPIQLFGEQTAGLASGFANLFANLGGLTFALTLGAVRDATGSFDIGFYSLSGLCLAGLAATVALGRLVAGRAVAVE